MSAIGKNPLEMRLILALNGYIMYLSIKMPLDVKQLISQYLFNDNEYRFNEKYIGPDIQIINHSTIIRNNGTGYSTCIFGNEINPFICNKFNIHIKWTKCCQCFYLGWIDAKLLTAIPLYASLTKYRQSSTCIRIKLNYSEFQVYNHRYNGNHSIVSKTWHNVKQGDEFSLHFDFQKNLCYIAHNGKISGKLSLNYIHNIIHAFTLTGLSYYQCDEIQVIHCSMSQDKMID